MSDDLVFSTSDVGAMLSAMAAAMRDKRDELCALDGLIGDADHGISMALGFDAVEKALSETDLAQSDPTGALNIAAKAFLNAVGASTGPLYATAFMRAGAAVKGKADVSSEDVVAMIDAMATGIADRGKAELGDKTMLDVWRPAADAVKSAWSQGEGLVLALSSGAEEADRCTEATKAMTARMGRASRLGERSVGHVDPGAASAAILIRVMARTLDRSDTQT